MDNLPIVISFYTVNTPYQLEVLNLIQSCQQFGIECSIDAKDSQGSWARNVAMKPEFIRGKLLDLKRPLFWVDADAAFLKKPNFKQFLPYDISVRHMPDSSHDPRLKLNAASLFINYNDKMVTFVDEWVTLCENKRKEDSQNLLYLDQISLAEMLDKRQDLDVYPLPLSYCKIYDLKSDIMDPKHVVIEQYQASRRFWDLI